MGLDASRFINNRAKKHSLTLSRVNNILIAVIKSYQTIKAENVVFYYSQRGKIAKENYLRNRLVYDYLDKELKAIKDGTTNYNVTPESTEEYISEKDGLLHSDPIDIRVQIIDDGLSEVWRVEEQIYLAIECKRFTSGSVTNYVGDIEKFTNRTYRGLRLPFEGQIGFIEKEGLTHNTLFQYINKRLSSSTCTIETLKQLDFYRIKQDFDGSYHSEHKRKSGKRFEIFHLFFNYSNHIKN